MKKILCWGFGTLLIVVVGCQSPQFLIVGKNPNGVTNNCVVNLLPINRKANNFSYVKDALVNCDQYEIGDTLYLTRKNFTNF